MSELLVMNELIAMSAVKEAKISKLVQNIERFMLIVKTIRQFDKNTAMNMLDVYGELLDTYWRNCTSANIEAGSDIPFEANIFWWQTKGDMRYQDASNILIGLKICSKMVTLTKSHAFQAFHRVNQEVVRTNESTTIPMLEINVELLEQYWKQFVEAYTAIVKSYVVPNLVSNVYLETEFYYVKSKFKIKTLLQRQLIGFAMRQEVDRCDDLKVERCDDLKADSGNDLADGCNDLKADSGKADSDKADSGKADGAESNDLIDLTTQCDVTENDEADYVVESDDNTDEFSQESDDLIRQCYDGLGESVVHSKIKSRNPFLSAFSNIFCSLFINWVLDYCGGGLIGVVVI